MAKSMAGGKDEASLPYFYNSTVCVSDLMITKEEKEMFEERKLHIQAYEPPFTESEMVDPVSGEQTRVSMSTRASILH